MQRRLKLRLFVRIFLALRCGYSCTRNSDKWQMFDMNYEEMSPIWLDVSYLQSLCTIVWRWETVYDKTRHIRSPFLHLQYQRTLRLHFEHSWSFSAPTIFLFSFLHSISWVSTFTSKLLSLRVRVTKRQYDCVRFIERTKWLCSSHKQKGES